MSTDASNDCFILRKKEKRTVMPWGMMEKLLEKSMCNAVRRKRYLEKKSYLLSCDDVDDDGGGGRYSQSEITGKQRIPSWQIAPHV